MKFEKGQSGNPGGRPKSPYQGIAARTRHYEEDITVDEILELAQDSKRMGQLNPVDFKIVTRMLESFKKDGIAATNLLWDRAYGKAPEHVQLTGKDGAPLDFDGKITIEMVPAKPSDEELPALPPPADAIEYSDS